MIASQIYLDNHATTRVDPQVLQAMLPYLTEEYGNAGSRTHDYGRRAAEAVAIAREAVAALVGASPPDVLFTSGATESNNLAIKGVCHPGQPPGHIVTSCTEHHAVLDVCEDLKQRGWAVTLLPSNPDGRVTVADVERAMRPETRLVTLMWANNEIGVINDIEGVAALCKTRGVLLHSDAAQAVGRLPIDVTALGVDLLSVSAHKMYGPKGVGALIATRRARKVMQPLQQGGGQERGLRPGTLPVHQVVGLGEATRLAARDVEDGRLVNVRWLRDTLLSRLRDGLDLEVNGSIEHRLPGNLNVWLKGVDTEALAMRCTEVAFSTGSACTSASVEPSYVITALTSDAERAAQSARFGLGRFTTEEEVRVAAVAVIRHARALLAMSLLPAAGGP